MAANERVFDPPKEQNKNLQQSSRLTPPLEISSDTGATPDGRRYVCRYLPGDFGQHSFQLRRIDLVGSHQAADERIR
jgi:hypothetical protein